MKDLKELAKGLAQKISQTNDEKIEAAQTATINKVKTEVVEEAVKENLNVNSIDSLTTDEELLNTLQAYVKMTDIFKNGYFYTKKEHTDGSFALLWNESDGGGSQYYNKAADILSYVGTNDGNADGIAVQIYSKYRDGVNSGTVKNSGVRINVNPNGAFYTKGIDTTATGGSLSNEIAVKGDIPDLSSYAAKSDVSNTATTTAADTVNAALVKNFAKLWNNFNANDNSVGYFYTKKDNADNSYSLLFNESDGGGAQYYNKTANILSYVGVNDGDSNGICVQIYSKYKDAINGNTQNNGTRINVNPNGAFYTKGTNTSIDGGNVDNEIAIKADINSLRTLISALADRVSALENM